MEKYFYLQLSQMLRMILEFPSDCRFYLQVRVFFKSFYFEEKFGFQLELLGCPRLNAHIAPGSQALLEGQDCRITGNMACFFFFLFIFILLLFIDRFCLYLEAKGEETD